MRTIKIIIRTFSLLAIFSATAFAQIKCVDAKGKVTYTESFCPAYAVQKQLNLGGMGGSSDTASAKIDSQPSGRNAYANELDAKVAEAIGSGDMTKAKTYALTPKHWQMISDAEQRGRAPVVTGRTSADLRAEAGNSDECKQAKRSYDVESSSIRKNSAQIDATRRLMYSACGMDEPITIKVDNRTDRKQRRSDSIGNSGAFDPQTGQFLHGVAGGVINPQNGQFYPKSGNGYINQQTGQFMPSN